MQAISLLLKAICTRPLFSCKIQLGDSILRLLKQTSLGLALQTKRKLIVFLAFFVCLSTAHVALAGIAASPCDPQYYDSLRSRAWLEAQREITQNQNLIFKPDSVMEYVCFDSIMGVLAQESANMFSTTTRWGSVLPANSMTTALQTLVGSALNTYIAANFSHTFLGGRGTGNYTPGAITAGTYTCSNMATVWRQAKCIDFISNQTNDGFFTFEHYRDNNDKRFLPTACARVAKWTNEFNVATVNANTPWTEDDVISYREFLDPANCGDPQYSHEVETGVTVKRSKSEPKEYKEKVCLMPGCHYVPTGMNAGTCESN